MSRTQVSEWSTTLQGTNVTALARFSNFSIWTGIVGSVALILLIVWTNPAKEITGLFLLALMMALLILGVPIGVGMFAAGTLGVWKFAGAKGMASMLGTSVFNASASWSYSVIPLFIFMGIVLSRTGVTTKAFITAKEWFGKLPGGLAVATNFSGAGLAAASGSTIGISHAVGRMAIPEMMKAGYNPSLATGTVAVVGTLGQMIPPSILLVIYSGVAQTPVGQQLIAGIVPGFMLAVAFAVYIIVRATADPKIAPRTEIEGSTWRTKFASLLGAVPLLLVTLIVVGGIYTGIFTATEAGAFGAIAAVLIGAFLAIPGEGLLKFMKNLGRPLVESAVATGSVFLLIMGVMVLTRALALSQLPSTLAKLIVEMNFSSIGFILVLVVLYLVLGMFLDPLAMLLLTVPVLMEPIVALEINLIWFGIFFVLMGEIGQASPPIGMLSFVVHKLSQDPSVNLGAKISLWQVFRGVLPFIGVALVILGILIIFPEIVLWLPELSPGG